MAEIYVSADDYVIIAGSSNPIVIAAGSQGPQGPIGNQGEPGSAVYKGDTGSRGSQFLGSYATVGDLPAINNTTVREGDFAYVTATGELWKAS